MEEIAVSLLPIIVFFAIIQLIVRDINKKTIIKIVIGLTYTYIGLVLFLTGVNVGFMPAGNYLGQTIAGLSYSWIIIPIGMIIGYFIVKAEPAVFVLTKQVEELTDGAISAKAMGISLSIGVAVSVGSLYLMTTIVDRKITHRYTELYQENDLNVAFLSLGYGTVSNEIMDYLGLESNEKAVAFSVVTESTWISVKKQLEKKLQIDAPGGGIAFTIPLSSIGGKKGLQFLIESEDYQKEEESTLKKYST